MSRPQSRAQIQLEVCTGRTSVETSGLPRLPGPLTLTCSLQGRPISILPAHWTSIPAAAKSNSCPTSRSQGHKGGECAPPGTPTKDSWSLPEEMSPPSCKPVAPIQRGHSEAPNSSVLPGPTGLLGSRPGLCVLSSPHPWCPSTHPRLRVCPCSPPPPSLLFPSPDRPSRPPVPGRRPPSLQTHTPPGLIHAPPPQRPDCGCPPPTPCPPPVPPPHSGSTGTPGGEPGAGRTPHPGGPA